MKKLGEHSMKRAEPFNALYESCFKRVYMSAYLLIRDETIAYDAAQEAFIQAFINLHRLKDIDRLEPWISAVAANKAKNMARKNARLVSLENTRQVEDMDNNKDPLRSAIRNERKDEVLKALNRLDLKFRQVIILKYYNALTDREIGQFLKLPMGTVKSRLHRGREHLKEMLIIKRFEVRGNE